jgi:hypothetical protein
MVSIDPAASFGISSVIVELGGYEYVVEGHSAADWVPLILSGHMYQILPGWIVTDTSILEEALLSGDVADEELNEATHDVMTLAGGRVWWWVTQLILMVGSDNGVWSQLHGQMVLGGIRAEDISLSAWVDALYSVAVSRYQTDEGRQKFDQALDTPPPSIPLDEEEEGIAFMKLMNASM